MEWISRDDSIDNLNFSKRTKNCMKNSNINTVADILDYPINDWNEIVNMGQKSVKEVFSFLSEYHLMNDDCRDVDISKKERNFEMKVFYDNNGQLLKDIEIEKSCLPVRAKSCFARQGYIYLSEIINLSNESIIRIDGMGKKTAYQIIDYINMQTFIPVSDLCNVSEDIKWIECNAINYIKELINYVHISFNEIVKIVIESYKLFPDIYGESIIYMIYEQELIKSELKTYMYSFIEQNNGEIAKSDLEKKLPSYLLNTTIIDELLLELEFDDKIEIENNIIRCKYISVKYYIQAITDVRIQGILEQRIIYGETLEGIGNKYKITRERIRQIIEKEINKFPTVKEDKYLYLFETYDFSLEDFKLSFGEYDYVYYYLTVKNKNHDKKMIDEVLIDDKVSDRLKKCVEKAIYKNYILLNGVYILKRRPQLIQYYVRTYCKEKIQFKVFKKQYNEFLANYDIVDKNLLIESRAYENHLNSCNYVLWNQWSTFRYYNILEYQYDHLLDQLNFEQYHNVEMSTLKFFRDNLELMKEYNILDEYELHNLLKKVCNLYKINNVHFGKMPTISFGNVDRDNQVLELLIQFAPISIEELSNKYEEHYGVKAVTFAANHLKNFNEYLHNGIYIIDQPDLSYEQYEYMLTMLEKDIYTYDEIIKIFKQKYIDEREDKINSYTIKKLGFKTYTHFVLKSKYENAYKYFNKLLTSEDIFSISNFDDTVLKTAFFYNVLYDLKVKKEIIEFEPNQYIHIRRLNRNGVSIEDIDDFCNEVYNFIDRGQFFTINSIKMDGFYHYLFDLCLDDWFYASILSETKNIFSNRKMCGTRVLYSGSVIVTLSGFIYSIIERKEKMEIYYFIKYLKNYYNINISRENLLTIINETDLYYNQIMDTVYINYDIYFEEI